MPWFWGRSRENDDEESYESYTDEEYEAEDDHEDHPSLTLEDKDAETGSGVLVENLPDTDNHTDKKTGDESHVSGDLSVPQQPRETPEDSELDEDEDSREDTTRHDEEDWVPERIHVVGPSNSGTGNRHRFPSALTVGDEDEEDEDDFLPHPTGKQIVSDEEEQTPTATEKQHETASGVSSSAHTDDKDEDQVTSFAEKRSLLVLAAEHDRVDIINAILTNESNTKNSSSNAATATPQTQDRETLLSTSIPPLHIAVAFGSTSAVNCLLRMGADPSIRPNVAAIQQEAANHVSETENNGISKNTAVDIPKMGRFDGMSAWELAFGNGLEENSQSMSGGWTVFGSPTSTGAAATDIRNIPERSNTGAASSPLRSKPIRPVDMAPSKREAIRHAFTAEALRCIGSDEVARLQQLVDAGMPADIDIGGKDLYNWSVEMGAPACEELLRPVEAARHGTDANLETADAAASKLVTKSAVLDRPHTDQAESVPQLLNRLDELASLAKALSTCLDNLAEEVSVCHGLLLMGGGASALASHVRSLKATQEGKLAELERMQEVWENGEDELAYWVREAGPEGEAIASQWLLIPESPTKSRLPGVDCNANESLEAQRRQLQAQIGASESQIRKLRVAIADLSEENARNLEEVEARGLTGGISLVRNIRDEIREIEFALFEAKNGEATCRTKTSLIISKVQTSKNPGALSPSNQGTSGESTAEKPPQKVNHLEEGQCRELADPFLKQVTPESGKIATGQSRALAIRGDGDRGFFPLSLWQILLRIIGIRDINNSSRTTPRINANNDNNVLQPAMIV